MRVLLTAFGTAGDNTPILALAEALRAQGDQPLLLLNPLYQAAAAARDLPFVPVGPRWSPEEVAGAGKYLHPQRGGIHIWRDFYLPTVARTFFAVRDAIGAHRPDVVVSHWLCFGGPLAAAQAGVRSAIVSLAPCWWYSRRDPSIYGPWDAPRWLRRWMLGLPRALVNQFIGASMRGVCRELGVPYRRDRYFATLRDADLNLALWAPQFRGPAADDPPRATLCGFPTDAGDTAALPADLERFLAAGPPPVVVGLGSSVKVVGDAIYREVGRACRDLDCRAVLVGAPADTASPGVLAIPAAPYRALFPRARAIVHHGGIGSLADALRAGRPTAIVPFANDQHDNACRAKALGTSVTWTRRDVARGLRPALARLLDDTAARARAIAVAAELAAAPDGATVAARVIAG